jgi:dipeptidyl aminopeptidase/acylaminoacyl peptidase
MKVPYLAMSPLVLTERESLITPETVSLGGVTLGDLQSHGSHLYFASSDPARQGKASVQTLSAHRDDNHCGPETLTDLAHNVRSAVHEYGGASFCAISEGIIYTDFSSKAVFWKKQNSDSPQQVFPKQGEASACRFADFSVVERSGKSPLLLAVMEDHTNPAPELVQNSVVIISLDGDANVVSLASGHDFYSYPAIQNNQLAFVAWNHPNMPWDETSLYVLELDEDFQPLGEPQLVHGGSGISVSAPHWYDIKLYFLSNANGWYNLQEYNVATKETKALLPKEADFSEHACGWILGIKCFAILKSGLLVAKYSNKASGATKVVLIDLLKDYVVREVDLPVPSISHLTACDDSIYFLGGSTNTPIGVWYWECPNDASSVPTEVYSTMRVDNLPELQAFFSEPKLIKFPSTAGVGHAYGYYYPPNNLSSSLPKDFKPPLLVKAHGGPTSSTSTTFKLNIQFWTSRGFAILDVDYGGSTGYGREYMQSLKGQWGVVDVADVCSGATFCADQGLANREWLCIDGGSAGGYTTLAALAFKNLFKAGASLYGVGDLSALAEETHKFESRYLDGLIEPYPGPLYDERCPIKHVDKFDCPVILLQGDEDRVVPPNQAETMFDVLSAKGLTTALVMYKGEQHGFRKAENIKHALLSEYAFFCKIFGIVPQSVGDFSGVSLGERVDI